MYEYKYLKKPENINKIRIEIPFYFLEKYPELSCLLTEEDKRTTIDLGDFDINDRLSVISFIIDINSGKIECGENLNGDYLIEVNFGLNITLMDKNILAYREMSSIFYEKLLPGFQKGFHEVLNLNIKKGVITNWYGKDNMKFCMFEDNEIDYGDGEGL